MKRHTVEGFISRVVSASLKEKTDIRKVKVDYGKRVNRDKKPVKIKITIELCD